MKDMFIIGGGINGVAIAADAAGRGLSVTLCEKNDLASATSSASSKLIHGGLRYLELGEFGLVKKALREREILMNRLPNLITPLEFVLPCQPYQRPAWMISIGLFLYDHLAKRQLLPGSKKINLSHDVRGDGLQSSIQTGFSYFDCHTDDARLVIANALSAAEHGAEILPRHVFVSAYPDNQHWVITVKNTLTEEITTHQAKTLINTAGPWVNDVQDNIQGAKHFDIEWVKGSHIILPKLYDGNFAYLLQNKDQRIVFLIPYENQFTLIGTTDVFFSGNLNDISISTEEINYLCCVVADYFKRSITPNDIINSYSGVRCLQKSNTVQPAKITRDYSFDFEYIKQAPLLTVISGKLTTHRVLAEEAMSLLRTVFSDLKPTWTANTPLPGGEFSHHDFSAFCVTFYSDFSWLPESVLQRYARDYGTRAYKLLANAQRIDDMGVHIGHGLYQREVDFLLQHEWAKTSDDILWRRTKLGLVFSEEQKAGLDCLLK